MINKYISANNDIRFNTFNNIVLAKCGVKEKVESAKSQMEDLVTEYRQKQDCQNPLDVAECFRLDK